MDEVPPGAEEFARWIGQQIAEAGDGSTLVVPWRGGEITVPVVEVPTARLWLNPASRRIRAAREAVDARCLDEAPWSEQAQRMVTRLLRADPADPEREDPELRRLRDSLQTQGQQAPAVITRSGLVVNGNTRATLLSRMQVAVLPDDATWDDVEKLERWYQLQRIEHRPYSWINRLLAWREAHEGLAVDAVAAVFGTTRREVEQGLAHLQWMRALIDRSRSGNTALRLVDFEPNKTALELTWKQWGKPRKADDVDAAETLMNLRLVGIATGATVTTVRDLGGDVWEHVAHHLPEEWTEDAAQAVTVPGLGITVEDDTAARVSERAADAALRGWADQVAGDAPGEEFSQVKRAFTRGVADWREALRRPKGTTVPGSLGALAAEAERVAASIRQDRINRQVVAEEVTDQVRALEEAVMQVTKALMKLGVESEFVRRNAVWPEHWDR